MRWSTAFSLFLASACTCSIASEELPPGWRLPTKQELGDKARLESSTLLARAVADFNADGVDDTALLLKSARFSGEALWVHLSKGPAEFEWIKLAEIRWGKEEPNVGVAMGIDTLSPGVHSYGCFDDTKGECNFGPPSERPKLKLADPSLMYSKLGSAASLFFWSNKHKRFLRVWLSD